MHQQIHSEELLQFALRHAIEGVSDQTLECLFSGQYPLQRAEEFQHFYRRIETELFNHPVITSNPYTRWFSTARLSSHDVRHFIVQFSVFSNQFLLAQAQKMVNARTLDDMHASKEILANEIGVAFKTGKQSQARAGEQLGDCDGSVEGGSFHFAAGHFEILVKMAEHLNLGFEDLGRREHGTPSTLFYCDELIRIYGSPSYATSEAASFAVEHWAAAGFWKELIAGLKSFKQSHELSMPLTFFTWHDRIEDNHARHTKEELESYYFKHDVDEDAFIDDANEMLDGVYAFWKGLDNDRRSIH